MHDAAADAREPARAGRLASTELSRAVTSERPRAGGELERRRGLERLPWSVPALVVAAPLIVRQLERVELERGRERLSVSADAGLELSVDAAELDERVVGLEAECGE